MTTRKIKRQGDTVAMRLTVDEAVLVTAALSACERMGTEDTRRTVADLLEQLLGSPAWKRTEKVQGALGVTEYNAALERMRL